MTALTLAIEYESPLATLYPQLNQTVLTVKLGPDLAI